MTTVAVNTIQNGVMIFIAKISIEPPLLVVIKTAKNVIAALINAQQTMIPVVDVLIQELHVTILFLGAMTHHLTANLQMVTTTPPPTVVVNKTATAQLLFALLLLPLPPPHYRHQLTHKMLHRLKHNILHQL